jgi:hypothetical protein
MELSSNEFSLPTDRQKEVHDMKKKKKLTKNKSNFPAQRVAIERIVEERKKEPTAARGEPRIDALSRRVACGSCSQTTRQFARE